MDNLVRKDRASQRFLVFSFLLEATDLDAHEGYREEAKKMKRSYSLVILTWPPVLLNAT